MGAIDAKTFQNGVFQIIVPGPGRYVLIAEAPGGSSLAHGRKEIEVGDADVRDVRLQVTPVFKITGNVTFEGRLPDAFDTEAPSLSFYPMSVGMPAVKTAGLRWRNGSFTVQNVTPGDYRLEISPILTVPPSSLVPAIIESAYVKSARLDGKDVLNGGIHLEKETNGPLQVVISMNAGTVEGHVVDSAGKSAPNVKAVAVPNAPRRQRGDLYKFVSTDDSGAFQLNGLAPGEYKLFTFERVEEGAWQDAEFIKLFEKLGTVVRVEEGTHVTVDLNLIPAWN